MKTTLKKNVPFFLFVLMTVAVRWSFADQYRVPTGSMEPTIHVGDHVFINKMAYGVKLPFTDIQLMQIQEPQKGDIVVFTSPDSSSMNLIKRLIATPGDHVSIRNGQVSINGSPISGSEKILETMANSSQSEIFYPEHLGSSDYQVKRVPGFARYENFEFVVPEDKFFFMGDNRDNSHDGRYFGLVSRELLKGRALGVLWNIHFENGIPEMELSRIGSRL